MVSVLSWISRGTAAALVLLATGCASTPLRLAETVGPAPEATVRAASGRLQVYTDTYNPAQTEYGPSVEQPYTVLDSRENELRRVASPYSTPELVTLEVGDYIVRGPGFGLASVDVPVHIDANRTTEVHLESSAPWVTGGAFVRSPDGAFVGWRAAVSSNDHRAPRAVAPAP